MRLNKLTKRHIFPWHFFHSGAPTVLESKVCVKLFSSDIIKARPLCQAAAWDFPAFIRTLRARCSESRAVDQSFAQVQHPRFTQQQLTGLPGRGIRADAGTGSVRWGRSPHERLPGRRVQQDGPVKCLDCETGRHYAFVTSTRGRRGKLGRVWMTVETLEFWC